MNKYMELFKECPRKIHQNRRDISIFCKYVDQLNPTSVLEIGSADGGSLWLWSRLASKDAKIMSIEPNPVDYEGLIRKEQEFILFDNNSDYSEIIEEVKDNVDNVDFLFVDGDHTLARTDYENYKDLVSDGIIAFHDINCPHHQKVGIVWRNIVDSFNSRPHDEWVLLTVASSKPIVGIGAIVIGDKIEKVCSV